MAVSSARGPASPCVGVCTIDAASGYCEGCLRTLGEIAAWRDASDAVRAAILRRICERREAGHRTVAVDQPAN